MAIKHVKTSEFDEIMDAAPLAMVDFWASWCGPCKMLSPTVEALAEQYEGKALVCKVNVDEEPDLARRFGVMSIPTVVFLKNGLCLLKYRRWLALLWHSSNIAEDSGPTGY